MKANGFTLLEVLLAIAAFSVAISALVLLERSVVYTAADFEQEVDELLRIEMLFSQIAFDISGLYTGADGVLLSDETAGENRPLLSFVTSSHINLQRDRYPVIDICVVSYQFRAEQGSDGFTLLRTEFVPPAGNLTVSPPTKDITESFELITSLRSFEVAFVDQSGKIHQKWDSRTFLNRHATGGSPGSRFPRSIIIKVEISSKNRPDDRRYVEKEIHLSPNRYGSNQSVSS